MKKAAPVLSRASPAMGTKTPPRLKAANIKNGVNNSKERTATNLNARNPKNGRQANETSKKETAGKQDSNL